jgi:hypothetical protein
LKNCPRIGLNKIRTVRWAGLVAYNGRYEKCVQDFGRNVKGIVYFGGLRVDEKILK